jgi:hypothetical protein
MKHGIPRYTSFLSSTNQNSQLLITLIHQPTIVLPAFQPAFNKNDKGKLREIF